MAHSRRGLPSPLRYPLATMSFYMPYGTGKKPTKHADATVRVFLAKFKCANVLAAFLVAF